MASSFEVKKGLILIKFYLSVNKPTQKMRFHLREKSKLKYWKLSENDLKTLKKWEEYSFYKNQMLALRELDFLIPKQKNKYFKIIRPLIIECKYDSKISDRHRSQLRQYLKSVPYNSTKELKETDHGVLLNWQKSNIYDETRVASETPIQIELWFYDKKKDMRLVYTNID